MTKHLSVALLFVTPYNTNQCTFTNIVWVLAMAWVEVRSRCSCMSSRGSQVGPSLALFDYDVSTSSGNVLLAKHKRWKTPRFGERHLTFRLCAIKHILVITIYLICLISFSPYYGGLVKTVSATVFRSIVLRRAAHCAVNSTKYEQRTFKTVRGKRPKLYTFWTINVFR